MHQIFLWAGTGYPFSMGLYQYIRQEWYRKSANTVRNQGPCPTTDPQSLELVNIC